MHSFDRGPAIRTGASSNLVLSSLVFEYSCDAIVLLDSESTVRALNPAAQDLLGCSDQDVVGRLDCRTVLGCRNECSRPGVRVSGTIKCLCQRVQTLHRAVPSAQLIIRPRGGHDMVVSASCAPLPIDHLGGAVLVLRCEENVGDGPAADELRCGELHMFVARHQVYAQDRPLHLTPIEFDLLRVLLSATGRVVSRANLLHSVWRCQAVNDRDLIKSHITALRRRLRAAGVREVEISNIYGVGYRLDTAHSGVPSIAIHTAPGDL